MKTSEVISVVIGVISLIVAVMQLNQDADSNKGTAKNTAKSNGDIANTTKSKSESTVDTAKGTVDTAKSTVDTAKSTVEVPMIRLEPCSKDGRCPDLKWIKVPAGHFEMGSNQSDSDEGPRHRVKVKAFLMSETEVTVEQYATCMERGLCSKPKTGGKCTWGRSGQYPINCISWQQARNFALWVGGDLPTEAQWEYAARGGSHHKYAGSDDPSKVAWYTGNTDDSGVRPVKNKAANNYGLYDLSGNLWE